MAIVFIHSGYSPYLEFSLRQARAADPDADIVLLGDAENDRFPFLRHVDATAPAYREAVRPFAEVFRHLSTNRYAFEFGNFRRWFWLRTFVEADGLEDALVLDSDVMLYVREEELRRRWLSGKAFGVCLPASQPPYRWTASPHVSYWPRETVHAFCDYVVTSYTDPRVFRLYEEKWQHHLDHGLYGGITDMTQLYRFAQEQPANAVANFVQVVDGATCDRNLNLAENEWPEEYRMERGYKALTWEGGRPYGFNTRLDRPVRFLALHCQGAAKGQMGTYYKSTSTMSVYRIGTKPS